MSDIVIFSFYFDFYFFKFAVGFIIFGSVIQKVIVFRSCGCFLKQGNNISRTVAYSSCGFCHLVKSVRLPGTLRDLGVKDKSNLQYWAEEAHKEQRLLGRSPRVLSVEDIKEIYEMAF